MATVRKRKQKMPLSSRHDQPLLKKIDLNLNAQKRGRLFSHSSVENEVRHPKHSHSKALMVMFRNKKLVEECKLMIIEPF